MSANKHKKESSDAETESSTVPDSTTREKVAFCIGDEVLMKRKDGNFYLGDIVEVDNVREQCLIKFGDNTESWSKLKHLTKLATGDGFDDDLVMCVMCKQSNSTPPSANNEIVVCNRCARGYHQLCHQPVISHDSMRNGSFWQCRRCQVPLIEELRAYRKKAAAVVKSNNSESRQQHTTSPNKKKVISDQQLALQTTLLPKTLTAKIQLPYDLKSLVWDEHHKVNTQQKYCYCGSSGDWYLKMLQCTRCKQWFHERCVSCLQYPLYLGDRFYVFVCSVCNFGVEFARRLEIGWVDMVHLALFNMTVFRAEKYHHIDEHIGYFINCNWAYLQLPPKINKVRPKERKNIISNVLIKNSSRFKSAREVKKSCSLWGLRLRVPPPCPPSAILPPILTPRTPLNEQRLLESDPSCKFLPLSDRPVVNSQKTDVKNQHHYQVQNGGGDGGDEWGDTGEQCTEVVSPILPKSWNKPLLGIKLLHIDAQPLLLPKGMPATGHKVCIKSSVPCFPESRSQIEKRIRAQKAENKKMKDLLARKARKLLKDAIATSQKISQDLPLTPPSSVSAPDTPHLSSSSSNNTTPPPQVTTAGDAASGATATTTPCVSLVSSEEDDDGDDDDDDCDYEDDDDDDTTSHGTLDSIIPPPKDFQGKNNPFVRSVGELLGGGVVAEEEPPLVESPSDPTITLPITLTPVITTLRPTKRRLSEKDIRINRNGEVKRRRLRRQCNVKGGKKDVTNGRYGQDVTYKVVNGKRLRSSTSKSIVTSQPSVTSSPVKNSGGGVAISLNDIKNSVNHYFGAANRIARGEMFTVRAKRVLADGRTEYLIEWHTQPAT